MQLHNHSQYSVIDGKGLIEDYIHAALDDGQTHFALTDHGTLGGIVDLYTACKKIEDDQHRHIKPIAGIEMYVDAYELREQDYPGHLTILAKNEAGYRALIAANNQAHRQFYYRPRITLQQIIENGWAENWYILTGCMSSPINRRTLEEATNIVQALHRASAGVFIEAMWHPGSNEEFQAKQQLYVERAGKLSQITGLPIILTNDCHFVHQHQEQIYQGIQRRSQENELEFDGDCFYFRTRREMEGIARGLGCDNAVANAQYLSEMCELTIPEADHVDWHVPDITDGHPLENLRIVCEGTLERGGYPPEYHTRYQEELAVLQTSSAILNSYLVAHDVVEWCKARGIHIGGRGSMAGSLVSHLMGITTEDPVKYNLSFNRAVNPARPSIPDFDLDVSSLRRAEILEYLKDRYAGNMPIVAYTHYGPKGALRKILRSENIHSFMETNALTANLPIDWPSYKMEWDPDIAQYVYPAALAALDDGKVVVEVGGTDGRVHATSKFVPKWLGDIPQNYRNEVVIYEGLYSTMSVHPSGVLISGPERPIEHEVPLQWIASSKTLSSAFDMYTLKKIGLFKLDVLGLRTLDQLAYMEQVSGERLPDDNYDEPEVLAAFGADLLAEIFQMDGYACRTVIRDIKGIETFEDIIAANTLARPGCAQFTPYYRSGYEGLLNEYPSLEPVLRPTNGLILYQEQVMEIARVLADFDDAEQDDVKESIKYFRRDHWAATIEPLFRARCEPKGIDATHILEAIARMASYTYNRAHAMTYAAIAYKMMWYKIHHPTVYYSAVFDASDDKARLILESHFFNVKWHAADINVSESSTVCRNNEIWLGLSAIKGVGPAAYEAITAARPFVSLEDLEGRVERRKCNVRVIGAMKNSYALTSLGHNGTQAAFEEAFGFNMRLLNVDLSQELAVWTSELSMERLAGFVVEVKSFAVKAPGQNQGKEMARVKIVNIKGSKEAVIFPETWRRARGVLYKGAPCKLTGQYQASGEFVVATGVIA